MTAMNPTFDRWTRALAPWSPIWYQSRSGELFLRWDGPLGRLNIEIAKAEDVEGQPWSAYLVRHSGQVVQLAGYQDMMRLLYDEAPDAPKVKGFQ